MINKSVPYCYTASETLALLERYEFNHTDFFDSKINAEHLIGRSSSDWEYQDFYRNNLNYSDGIGVGAQLVGIGKGVGTAVGDTVVGTYELGKHGKRGQIYFWRMAIAE